MAGIKLLTWLTAGQASHNQTFPGYNTARGVGAGSRYPLRVAIMYDDAELASTGDPAPKPKGS